MNKNEVKMFLFWTIGLSAYFQMQININVNILTRVENITSNSILFSNLNDC